MFSVSLFFASTGSTTMSRSVFLNVTVDSFADWFDLCTSARECVETFVSTRDCLQLLASTGDCVCFDRRFCDFKGRLKIPARFIWQIIQGPSLCIWNILILKCIEVHPVSFD